MIKSKVKKKTFFKASVWKQTWKERRRFREKKKDFAFQWIIHGIYRDL